MRVRTLLFLVAFAGLIHPSCGSDSPTNPSTPVVTTTTTTTPAPANRPPTVSIFDQQPHNTLLAGGTRATFGAKASDPDNDPLSFTWNYGDGQTTTGNGLAGVAHVYDREGTFTVTVTVSDGRGGTASADTTVTSRKLSGQWSVENAIHTPLTASITQGDGAGFQGRTSDGVNIGGKVGDPFAVTLDVSGTPGGCIPPGTYQTTLDPSLNTMEFHGGGSGCKNFTFRR